MKISFLLSAKPEDTTPEIQTAARTAASLAERDHQVTLFYICELPRNPVIKKSIVAKWHTLLRGQKIPEGQTGFTGIERVRKVIMPMGQHLPEADILLIVQPEIEPMVYGLPPQNGVKMLICAHEPPPPDTGAAPLFTIGPWPDPPPGFELFRYRQVRMDPLDIDALETLLSSLSGPVQRQYWFRFTPGHSAEKSLQGQTHGPVRILVLTCDFEVCAQVRILNALKTLEAQGDISIRLHLARPHNPPKKTDLDWAQIIVLQRIHQVSYLKLVNKARRAGKTVVYEIDDELFALDETHPDAAFWATSNAMLRLILSADRITVSTPPLEESLRSKGVTAPIRVIPNYLNLDLYNPATPAAMDEAPVVIGYVGTRTHFEDLEPCVPALQNIIREYGTRVRVEFFGCVPEALENTPGVTYIPGTPSYHVFARRITARNWHMALAPLKKTHFNDCKSRIKFLEYSLCGFPGIYTDWGPYSRHVTHEKNGLLVRENTPSQWEKAMRRLLDDPVLRQEIASNASKEIQQKYLTGNHLHEYLEFFAQCIK